MAEYILSFPGEAKLRKAFGMLNSWSARGLEMRLQERDIGLSSQNAARVLIHNGQASGLLLREGQLGNSTYRLNDNWRRPEWSRPANGYVPRKPRPEAEQDTPEAPVQPPAGTYVGPAFHTGPLAPHVGLRCAVQGTDEDGELLPCIGGAIVDSLRAGFHHHFSRME